MHHNNFYVYLHKRLDTNEIFYVGIGKTPPPHKVWKHNTKYSRAFEKTKRTQFWKNIICKTDYSVEIYFESENEAEVKLKEQELIMLYGRKCCDKNGTLVNFTSGGDRNDGPKNYNIRVIQKDLNNNIIKIWKQLKDIQIELGYLKTNIVKCCRKKQITAYGYIWEYDDDSCNNLYSTAARKKTTNRGVGIDLFDVNNKLVKTFRSQNEAAVYLNIHITTVHKYLNNKNRKNKFYTLKYKVW